MPNSRTPASPTKTIFAAAFVALLVAPCCAPPAVAQSGRQQGQTAPEAGPNGEAPKGRGAIEPKAGTPKGGEQKGARSKGILPEAKSDGARSIDKVPQTAEQKKRRLADLYAQLSAADSEENAAKLAGEIERLWRISGSDTVNLLISRAAKVAAEKRPELAEELLDRAVALAPDYTEGFSQRALFHFSQNNPTAAVGDLRRVLALDPNHFKAMEGLIQIWRESNKKGAYEVAKQLMDVHPFAAGARQAYEELKRDVEGRGI